MKKFLLATFIYLALSSTAQAAVIRAISLEDFSTAEPALTYKAQILDTCVLKNGTILSEGSIISGKVTNVSHAKRGKRDGYFDFKIDTITTASTIKSLSSSNLSARVIDYTPLNAKELTFKVARTGAGFVVKGATQGISFAQGFINAKGENRLKSGVVNVYKTSPLAYVEVGEELTVKNGDILIIKVSEPKE